MATSEERKEAYRILQPHKKTGHVKRAAGTSVEYVVNFEAAADLIEDLLKQLARN